MNHYPPRPPLPRPRLNTPGWLRPVTGRLWALVAIYALVNLASVRYMVDGISMEPAFASGQILIVSRLPYLFWSPQRGDVVVFHLPEDPFQDYIKRIIAIPGDTLEIRHTQVFINGVLQDESYLAEPCGAGLCENRIWQIGSDEYFMMGDNRNHSSDSRIFGPVKKTYVLGKVILRYWPLEQAGFIH